MFYILMFVLGAAIGSFLCCQARRLRLKETKQKKLGPRSVCLHCGKKLNWYENIPIISWCIQKGKCKKCGKKIGNLEIISEISTALTFLITSFAIPTTISTTASIFSQISFFAFPTATPITWVIFIVALIFVSTLIFLAIYDGMCGELPTVCLIFAIIFAAILAALNLIPNFSPEQLLNYISSAVLFGGLYLILYLISHGRWVGDGDWLLALAIGLALGSPFRSLCAIFAANFTATLIMYPIVKKQKTHKIYFGPFLVLSYVIIILCISLKVIP